MSDPMSKKNFEQAPNFDYSVDPEPQRASRRKPVYVNQAPEEPKETLPKWVNILRCILSGILMILSFWFFIRSIISELFVLSMAQYLFLSFVYLLDILKIRTLALLLSSIVLIVLYLTVSFLTCTVQITFHLEDFYQFTTPTLMTEIILNSIFLVSFLFLCFFYIFYDSSLMIIKQERRNMSPPMQINYNGSSYMRYQSPAFYVPPRVSPEQETDMDVYYSEGLRKYSDL
ncbi:hypothetical protein WA158_002104 [Blastocystis sp. Blastoise]